MTTEQKVAKREYDRARYARLKAEREALKPADPIEGLTPEERAYIAGLIDGEGSIFVTAVGPNRKRTVYPTVVIAMTHRNVIDWLTGRIESQKVQLHNQTNLRRHSYMKPQYRFQVFGVRAKLLCQAILPYLKVKYEQARLVTQFPCDSRIGSGVRIPEELNAERYRLRDEINGLNHEARATLEEGIARRKSFLRGTD